MDRLDNDGTARRHWLKQAAAVVGTISAGGLTACTGDSVSVAPIGAASAAPPPAAPPSAPLTSSITVNVTRRATSWTPVPGVPAWVPKSAWEWTEIPGTTFNNYMKSDGTGIAPAAGPEPSGTNVNATYPYYDKQTSFGGPAYSRKNHELYMFGGGHAATTLNAVSRWNLHKDAPDMTLVCAPTPASIRQQSWLDPAVRASGYWPDGKPKSAHMYHALQYLDAFDELIAVGLANASDPVLDSTNWPVVACFGRGESAWKPSGYWPDLPSGALADAPCFTAWNGESIYYYNDRFGSDSWRSLRGSSRSIAPVGGSLGWWRGMRGAARHDEIGALLVGGESGGGEGYQFKLLDVTTGRYTPMSSAGYPFPVDCRIKDLVWVSSLGCWIGWFTDVVTDNASMKVQRLIKFVQSSSTTITASLIATTGSPPIGNGGCEQGMYWDETYGCLIFVGHMSENLRALKVA